MTQRTWLAWGLLWFGVAGVGACGGGGGGGGGKADGLSPLFVTGPSSSLGAVIAADFALGYFDDDAQRDLIVPGFIEFEQHEIVRGAACYLGAPDGTFRANVPVTVGAPQPEMGARVLVGHFDAGPSQDFVVVAGRYFGVLRGLGDGTFDPAASQVQVLPFGLVATDAEIIDANHDFYDDLVVGTETGDLAMLLGDDSGGFLVFDVLHPAPGRRIVDVVVAGMNYDAYDDVVALDSGAGVTVMFGDGGSSLMFGSSILVGLAGDAVGIAVGGFDDADGEDLAVLRGPFASPTPHVNVTIVTGDGAGGFGTINGAVAVPEASFPVPGRVDLVWRSGPRADLVVAAGGGPGTSGWNLYLIRTDPDGTGAPTAERIPVPGETRSFRAVDMNGDWLSDLVVVQTDDAADSVPWGISARILYGVYPPR